MPAGGGQVTPKKAQRLRDPGVASSTGCEEAQAPAHCTTLAFWIPASGWRGKESWVTLAGQGKAVAEAAAQARGEKGWGWEAEPAQVAAHGAFGGGLSVCLTLERERAPS